MSFIVAIDGPAGTGKGTITKLIAKDFGLINIDTGATYRCVTLEMINQNVSINEKDKIIKISETIKIDIKNSVYSISNYMRQIQRLFDSNILRDWNEDIISIQKR